MKELESDLQGEQGETAGRYANFVDPGPLPGELMEVPGFISALADWTMRHGHSPNRTLAFTGALAMLAHLAGRSYADESGTRTNLYVIVLGNSGIGKDDPRKTNKRLMERLEWSQMILESVASGEALEDEIVKHPSLFFQPDEVASLFGQMRGQGKAAKSLSDRVRRLFTSSDTEYVPRRRVSKGRHAAGALCEQEAVHFPHLTIFGTGVPDEMLDALTPMEIQNGLFGRCLVLNVEDENRRQVKEAFVSLPERVVEVGKMLVEAERRTQESGVIAMRVVPATDEAKAVKKQAMEFFGRQRGKLAAEGMRNAAAIVARIDEKISKLALIYALSENPYAPRITQAAAEWAVAFSVHVLRWMLYEAQFHLSEGKFGRLMDRAKAIMSKNGGSIDRQSLIRRLRCDVSTFMQLIKTLLVAGDIEDPVQINGKITYSLSN